MYTSLINFHTQLQSMKQCIRLLLTSISSYKVWNCVYVPYKLLHPVTQYETVYTSLINFHTQLQSMKQCIRLLLTSTSSYKVWNSVYVLYKLPHPVTKSINCIRLLYSTSSYKVWNSVYVPYKLLQLQSMLHFINFQYETVYTSLINFHTQLQSMKQCIRLL